MTYTMTEAEAKKKWCPIMTNAVKGSIVDAYCVASECMAWQWDDQTEPHTYGYCGAFK